MAQRLAKHGSEAGYNAHRDVGDMCERCRNAHRVYARQYRPTGKAKGLHYGTHEVIDHLYSQSQSTSKGSQRSSSQRSQSPYAAESAAEDGYTVTAEERQGESEPRSGEPTGPTLADRLSEGMRKLRVSGSNDYVESDDAPDYLHTIDPDPEPEGDWSEVKADEFVIGRKEMDLIEDNLGTYLSVIGITMEMVDPYCGPILAENLETMVNRWTKVIARYPRAAKLFMSQEGGLIMLWIGAIQATWPVLIAVYKHHLSHEIQTDKGRIFRVGRSANGHQETVDATMPPMPQYDYTVN